MSAFSHHQRASRSDKSFNQPSPRKPTRPLRIRRFRRWWHLAVPVALVIALALQIVMRSNSGSSTGPNASQTSGDQVVGLDATPLHAGVDNPNRESTIEAGQRIVVIDRPGGLDLADQGTIVEVIAIGGGNGTIAAIPITSNALVVGRSDTGVSLLVSEAEALRILESQALGSISLLAVGE